MRTKSTKRILLTLGLVGCLTIPAYGEQWDFTWDHPCHETTQTCGGGCSICFPPTPDTCWCEADYNDANNWSSIGGGYPDESTETALIEHSNTGYCANNAKRCSQDSDFRSPNTCVDPELYQIVHLIDETIQHINIRTDQTTATNEKLDIRFSMLDVCIGGSNNGTECTGDGDCTGGGTCDQGTKVLTVGVLTLDAVDGPITLTAESGNIETE